MKLITDHFEEIPSENLPKLQYNPFPLKVFKNPHFLVQLYKDGNFSRLSINRCQHINGKWLDKITWDDLQEIKNNLGFHQSWCMECFPPMDCLVNVVNIRHLFVLNEAPQFGFFSKEIHGTF
jgi:hypothetical protein